MKSGIILDEKTCKKLRSAMGTKTLTALADELGVTYQTISYALNQRRSVSIDLLDRIAGSVGLIAEVTVEKRSRIILRRA